jgi:hypothetical protein
MKHPSYYSDPSPRVRKVFYQRCRCGWELTEWFPGNMVCSRCGFDDSCGSPSSPINPLLFDPTFTF